MMNGARGLSVLFASGDQGVWGRTGHSETIPGFHPDFTLARGHHRRGRHAVRDHLGARRRDHLG